MRFYYISPSVLPSRSANSVHVVLQCEALKKCVSEIRLFAKRSVSSQEEFLKALSSGYGVGFSDQEIVSCYSESPRGDNIKIALTSLAYYFSHKKPDVILSRNLYASFVLGVLLRRPLLFETHQLETGLRKRMQRMIMTRKNVTTVAISSKLVEFLAQHHKVMPHRVVVLHDAAPAGIEPLASTEKGSAIENLIPQRQGGWRAVCGYFGHLYAGRGVEIIEAMARERPDVLFLVFGGNESDVLERKRLNVSSNLVFLGHVAFPVAQQAMKSVDVLLMPYQESVSIGIAGHDTAKWMSPMKMFEYMATGVPLISSDLPVLREVLHDGVNALLVAADNVTEWVAALDRLLSNADFAKAVGAAAHADYATNHTWEMRALKLIEAARSTS